MWPSTAGKGPKSPFPARTPESLVEQESARGGRPATQPFAGCGLTKTAENSRSRPFCKPMVPITENQPVSIVYDLPRLGLERSEKSGDTKTACSALCSFAELRSVRFNVWRGVDWRCRFKHLSEFACVDPPPTKTRSPTLFTRPGNAGGNGRSTTCDLAEEHRHRTRVNHKQSRVSPATSDWEPEGRTGHRSMPSTHRGQIHATP